jgi:tryptophanyl-tRNA synthetase
VEVKEKLFLALKDILMPIREKREYYENHLDEVKDILNKGVFTTREQASQTLDAVKSLMQLNKFKYNLRKIYGTHY